MVTLVAIGVGVALVLTLGRWIERLNQRCWAIVFAGNFERARSVSFLVLAPGVIIHELSHFLMALLMGEKVDLSKSSLFHPVYDAATGHWRLGQIVHTEAPDPWRNLLIGAAPLVFGPVVLIGLLLWLGTPLPKSVDPITVLPTIWEAFKAAGWKAPLLFYAFFNLGTTVLVSPQDMQQLRPAAIYGVPIVVVLVLISQLLPLALRTSMGDTLSFAGSVVVFFLLAMVLADAIALLVLFGLYKLLSLRALPLGRQG